MPGLEERLARLQELRGENARRRLALLEAERASRRDAIEGWGSITERLNRLRIVAIENLPAARSSEVLGLSREGISQLGREIEQLELSARLYRARQIDEIDRLPGQLLDVFTVGSVSWIVLKALLLVFVYLFLRRRGVRIREASHNFVGHAFTTTRGQARATLFLGVLEVVAPWGLFLALIEALRWSFGPLAQAAELDLPLRIATLYGIYRLSVDVLFSFTVRIVRHYRLSLDEQRTEKVLRSMRTMMRVVVGIFVGLEMSKQFVGRGYLYHLVVRFSWILVLGAALLVLARWRQVISDAYLSLGGDGRLAALVRRSRDRWYGVFVSAAAFTLLAGWAALQVGRDFAMGFEHTHRALAFMFRRRVEKRAEVTGYADGSVDDLDPVMIKTFTESPLADGSPGIDHYPGLDRMQAMIEPWLQDEGGASFLLTGEKGMGKTSWLNRIEAGAVPIDRVVLAHRLLTESRLAGMLAQALDLPLEEGAGMSELRKALLQGPKRIVTVDLGQNLFLGMVGGYDTFESFVSMVEATCERVFWVCSISAFAWDTLASVRPDLIVFRDRQALSPWSEVEIGRMLQARMEIAGVEVTYDDLLVEGPRGPDPELRKETAEQYMRLLWDYSDGNPRVALHYWLRSLVPDGGNRLRVRLFRSPASGDLDRLNERSRFLLAALVVHENLTMNEAALVTRYPGSVCRLLLERLHDDDVVYRNQGRYRLTTHWHRAVVRFLKRGNLLSG